MLWSLYAAGGTNFRSCSPFGRRRWFTRADLLLDPGSVSASSPLNVNSLSLTAMVTSDKAIPSDDLSFGNHDVVLYSIRYSGDSNGKAVHTLEAGAGAMSSLSRP